jgi:hypothetical protein
MCFLEFQDFRISIPVQSILYMREPINCQDLFELGVLNRQHFDEMDEERREIKAKKEIETRKARRAALVSSARQTRATPLKARLRQLRNKIDNELTKIDHLTLVQLQEEAISLEAKIKGIKYIPITVLLSPAELKLYRSF